MRKLVKFLASAGYVGYAPFWPGAFGSLVGIGLSWFFFKDAAPIFFFLTLVGLGICKPATQIYEKHDPQVFVLDEVCGMMLTLLALPKEPTIFITGYFLFRLFDVWKPWVIGKLERLPSPLSIMWDDLAAGFASNIILQLIFRLILNH